MAKQENHEGDIYLVNPKHLIKKKDWGKYINVKNGTINKRLVIVGEQRRGKVAQISNLTTKATPTQITRKQRVRLDKTFPNKNSYADTNTLGKSRLNGKKFKIGRPPLTKAKNILHSEDLKAYKEARKARGR